MKTFKSESWHTEKLKKHVGEDKGISRCGVESRGADEGNI